MKYLWTILCLSILPGSMNAQAFDRAKMDSLLARIEAADRGMFSLAIARNGQAAYRNAIGYADVAAGIEATPATRYRIGSITKPFTAVLILKLIDQGELTLDTRLADFFPAIPNAEQITVEQMLRHRSGIFNFTNAPDYPSWMEEPIAPEDLLSRIASHPSAFPPGGRAEYSNSNYVLLSFIAEELTRSAYAELVQERICAPCGLQATYYGRGIDPDRQEARSYRRGDTWTPATETDMSVPRGAGALVSTAADLNAFLHCLFSGKLLRDETLDAMRTLQDGFGMGLLPAPFYERQALGHNGGIDGFVSSAYYFPEDKVAVTLLSNGQVMPINDILIGVLSIYFGREYELPEFKPAVTVPAEVLDRYPGVYSSETFPLKITISRKGDALFGQATGQPEFPLEATSETAFRFEPAGLVIEFDPDEANLTLTQMGQVFVLERE